MEEALFDLRFIINLTGWIRHEVRKLENRETINGQPFSKGDYMVRIGRYFDKDASDATGLTFEEWQPELVFTTDDVRDSAQQAYLPNMYLHYFATI